MRKLAAGLIGLGLALAPAALAQSQQKDRNMDPNLQRAIQFEHTKDADDARQAAIEKKHPTVVEPQPGSTANPEANSLPGQVVTDSGPGRASQSADRQASGWQSADRSADREDTGEVNGSTKPAYRTQPTPAELNQAVAWEHHKDAAAARQAAIERQPSSNAGRKQEK